MPSIDGVSIVQRVPPQADGEVIPVAVVDSRFAEYESVAASATAQVIGNNGAAGDYIDHIVVIPETLAAGTVSLLDGSTSYDVFVTGTLTSLVPFSVALGIKSMTGPWKITTGANVHCLVAGKFT